MNYLIHFINSIFLPEIIRQHGGKILIVLRLILIPRSLSTTGWFDNCQKLTIVQKTTIRFKMTRDKNKRVRVATTIQTLSIKISHKYA